MRKFIPCLNDSLHQIACDSILGLRGYLKRTLFAMQNCPFENKQDVGSCLNTENNPIPDNYIKFLFFNSAGK